MRPQTQVIVELDDRSVPGLVLKAGRDGTLLVTYEVHGRVETAWVPAERVQADEQGQQSELD